MKLSDFDYILPKELIAQYPLEDRAAAKLLVCDCKKQTINHKVFSDIIDFIDQGDCLVLNNTKVLSCRLKSKRKTGGSVEVFLLNRKEGNIFEALFKPGRLRIGEEIIFPNNIVCKIIGKNLVEFNTSDSDKIYSCGQIPLPPYIKRTPDEKDKLYYQTVYAKENGSVASPTAGLHFTPELLEKIKQKNISIVYVTLHVGLGTFKMVKSDDITTHPMDYEYYCIDDKAIDVINETKKNKKRVFAVGTTSCRVLESFANLKTNDGQTNLFIYPGYKFKLVDCLITNFHLPKTTLFMLVCALAGFDFAHKAYQEAISNHYRFYSYGDAMLVL